MQGSMRSVEAVVEQGIAQGLFPGAVLHVEARGEVLLDRAYGMAEQTPLRRKMHRDLLFDMASLTKVMATLPAVLRSVQTGKIDLFRSLGHYLPDWRNRPGEYERDGVTVAHLLTHTSGLPAWRPYYLRATTPERYLDLICQEPPGSEAGAKVVYSDLGFILAGLLLEQVWQKPLEEVCAELVFRPLGMEHTGFRPQVNWDQVVATEQGNAVEHRMCSEYAEQCRTGQMSPGAFQATAEDVQRLRWRTATICGEVHDCNAHYGLQGAAGHAGLFSTAADAARYLRMWAHLGQIDGREYLLSQLVRLATMNRTPQLNIARGLGWEAAPDSDSAQAEAGCSAGAAAAAGAFGHTGFTGTSLWYDPSSQVAAVVLTNRVHPEAHEGMPAWRRELHTALFASERG